MVQEELSKEDKRRVRGCEFYSKAKEVIEAHEKYKDLALGEVYFIKYKGKYSTDHKYVTRNYGNDKPSKFMIFHKDKEGFVFMKRINANGKLGKEVLCLTTQYSEPCYILEPDPDYVDSILFQSEASYDPLKSEKELNKNKGKARRRNKKLEITYKDAKDAFERIAKYKVGDKLYDAGTSYGKGIMEWEITGIEARPTDQTENTPYPWNDTKVIGNTSEDQSHNNYMLPDLVILDIKVISSDRRRWTNSDRKVTFEDFIKRGHIYYENRPCTTDDV